jgi:hypothetical protein
MKRCSGLGVRDRCAVARAPRPIDLSGPGFGRPGARPEGKGTRAPIACGASAWFAAVVAWVREH